MRTPLNVSHEVIAQFVDEYMREVKRIRRAWMREAVIHRCQEQGEPVLEGEEMETEIDVLEALIELNLDDVDKITNLLEEVELTPDGQFSSEQILQTLEKRRVRASKQVIDDATLDQYHFEVTGKLMTRCKSCHRGHNWTAQVFMHDRFLQRMVIGERVICLFCHAGQVKVYGVTAVLRDGESVSNEPVPLKESRSVLPAASKGEITSYG